MTTLELNSELFYQLSLIADNEAQYARGEYTTQLPGESLSEMLNRCGYV